MLHTRVRSVPIAIVANAGRVAAIPEVSELNIGHNIVARALLVGMERAVREMVAVLRRP